MKKLKLDLDQIQVATFSTHAAPRGRGTVQGLSFWTDPQNTNDGYHSLCDGFVCQNQLADSNNGAC